MFVSPEHPLTLGHLANDIAMVRRPVNNFAMLFVSHRSEHSFARDLSLASNAALYEDDDVNNVRVISLFFCFFV
jgi:hypothetical protein